MCLQFFHPCFCWCTGGGGKLVYCKMGGIFHRLSRAVCEGDDNLGFDTIISTKFYHWTISGTSFNQLWHLYIFLRSVLMSCFHALVRFKVHFPNNFQSKVIHAFLIFHLHRNTNYISSSWCVPFFVILIM
jgi:hypothetical protein